MSEYKTLTCDCGFEFDLNGFRNYGVAILADGSKIITCPQCGSKYYKNKEAS